MPKVGDKAPDFSLPDEDGRQVKLSDFRGRNVVVAFYPADATSVCTKQLCDYRDAWAEFSRINAVILAISTDSVASHKKFKDDNQFPFSLLSDPERVAGKAYGAAMPLMSIMKRGVFVIDKAGIIRYKYVEFTPLTRRRSEELLEALRTIEAA